MVITVMGYNIEKTARLAGFKKIMLQGLWDPGRGIGGAQQILGQQTTLHDTKMVGNIIITHLSKLKDI